MYNWIQKNTHKGLSLQEHNLIASEYSLILHKYKQSYRWSVIIYIPFSIRGTVLNWNMTFAFFLFGVTTLRDIC